MAKFVILLCCFCLSLAAAGVLDDKWLRYGRIDRFDTVNDELDRDIKIVDITRMTGTELERQKILLKLLDRVHEGLNDVTFRMNLREEFDTNEGNYKKGMDDDMLYVIQALQNGRLLGKRDTFTITNVEHKRQMIGLKRLLTRAVDFKTFLQNALTARQHINGVLFVNALLLAVREREDTRQLIVPAIYEILPELYIDRDTLRTLKNIDINLLTTNNGLDTRRPQLSDLIGLGMRKQQRDDWTNLGRLVSVTRPRNMRLELDDKIVIDDVNKITKIKTMKLLTEDVGFKGFLHQLLNDFCLKENELEKFELRRGRRVTDDSRRYGLDENLGFNYATRYGRKQYMNEYNRELPTTTIDDERLLHVNAKKLSQLNVHKNWLGGDNDRYQNMRDRFYDVVYDERRGNDLNRLNVNCLDCIERKNVRDCRQCLLTTDDYILTRLGHTCHKCVRDVNDYDCDKCKIDIDERRTNDVGTRFMDISRRNRIDDGRRIMTTNDYDVEGLLNRLNVDCSKCIERKNFVDCQKCKRTTDVDVIDRLTKNCKQCIRDANDYDCDKCKIDIDERRTNDVGTRFMDISHRNRIDDGRRIMTTNDYDVEGLVNRLNVDCRKCIERKNFVDCQKCKRTTDVDVIDRLTKNCKQCIRDVSVDDCDKCKRVLDNNVNLRWGRTDDSKIFGNLIENGRRTTYTSDYGVDRRQLQSLNTDCLKCIEQKDFFDCQKCKRTTDVDVIERLQRDCQRCIRVVNDDDCDRCKNLIDNKDSMRFGQTDERRIFGKHIDDGRRTVHTNDYDDDVDVAQLKRLNTDCLKCIERKNYVDCQKCKRVTDVDVIERLTKDCKQCIRDVNDYDCDKCKRKLELLDDGTLMRQHLVNTRIVDGRRTKYLDDERYRGSLDFDESYDIVDDVKDLKKGTKAELLLHNLKQILARLNLERLSLGLDTVTVTDVDVDDIRRKYTRNMMSVGLKNIDSQVLIETIKSKIERKLNTQRSKVTTITTNDINVERLIAEALIARTDSQDLNMLDLISDIIVQSFGVGIDVGDMQIVRVIGEALDDTKILKMLNKIVKIVDEIRTDILGSYKRQELEFDDVQINDVMVDDLVTYIKQQDVELTNMLNVDTNKLVVVRQPQLDHKDFKIKIDLNSRRQQRVVMRLFLGPKKLVGDVGRRQINLNERRNDFILLDTNVIDLNVGRNLIEKRSRDLRWTKLDTTTLHKIYKKVMLTAGKVNKFEDDVQTKIVISDDCRFPKHLLLPRGNVMGLDLELLVIVTPIESYKVDMLVDDYTSTKCTMGLSVKGVDRKSLGFPLDRHIDDSLDIRQLPNARIIDVKIFHDDDEERSFRGLN